MQQNHDYLNAVQAADYLGVGRQRIYQLADAGKIGRRIAGYWVFSKSELDAYKARPKSKGGRPKESAGILAAVIPA
jgi:excisionase family DNA binding protein